LRNLNSVTTLRTTLLAGMFLSSAAFAVGNSVITGTIIDSATKKPVEDVVVTATSPALQGEEVTVSDKTGTYRIPQLPGGSYVLRFEKSSYKLLTRSNITVNLDRTIRLNVEVQPDSVTLDTVVVVGKPPTVDVGSASNGVTIGKDFIKSVPLVQPNASGQQTFEDLAKAAPQVSGDTYGNGFNGGQSPENNYQVDGIQVNDPTFGSLQTTANVAGPAFPIEFLDEVNVITGGYLPEYGRASGGVLAVNTKSGGNETHGSVWGSYWPGALTANARDVISEASVFSTNTKRWNTGAFGAEVGGAVIKDKLWFYAGLSGSVDRQLSTRQIAPFKLTADRSAFVLDDNGRLTRETLTGNALADATQRRFNDSRSFSFIAKLTYNIDNNNNVSIGLIGSPQTNLTPNFSPRLTKGLRTEADSTITSLKYQGAFLNKTLLFDVTAGWNRTTNSERPFDDSRGFDSAGESGQPSLTLRRTPPHVLADVEGVPSSVAGICEQAGTVLPNSSRVLYRGALRFPLACPVTGSGAVYATGGVGLIQESLSERFQFRANSTYLLTFLGHHVLKAGVDIEYTKYNVAKEWSGGFAGVELGGGGGYIVTRNYAYFSGPNEETNIAKVISAPSQLTAGGFLQDSWQVMDLFTVNAGLRYDTQQLFASDGTLGISLNNMLSPRVGLLYDFTQQGKSKVYANYATYFQNMPLQIADRSLTGEFGTAYITPCDPLDPGTNTRADCRGPKNIDNEFNGSPYAVSPGIGRVGNGRVAVDPALRPSSKSEITAGAEYEVISDMRIGGVFTHNWLNNVIEDMSNDEANTYFIGNPGFGLAKTFPRADRRYFAATATLSKNFSDGWLAQASYTWSSLYGNFSGLFRPETGQLDPGINSDFDLKSLLPNRTGFLPADRTHFIKGFGSKTFDVSESISLRLGLAYEGRSGTPIDYLARHPIYGASEVYVLPRGSGGRLPWIHSLNASGAVVYRVTKTNSVEFNVDVFNFINAQATTAVSQQLSTLELQPVVTATNDPQRAICISGTGPCESVLQLRNPQTGVIRPATADDLNPNFKQPIAYQQPLAVKFGVRLTF
jgi:Carboxypeptidase regulatory-like domain/TonB dependent receptor